MIFINWRRIKNYIVLLFILIGCFNNAYAAKETTQVTKNKKSHHAHVIKKVTVHKKKKLKAKSAHRTHHKMARKKLAKKKPSMKTEKHVPASIVKSDINTYQSSTQKFVATIEKRLVDFVHKTVTTLRYSAYKLGGSRFDPGKGIYIVDCSSYVDYILKTIHPRAYSSLVNSSRSAKPTTDDYYHFFTKLISKPQYYWSAVEDVEELRPGDLLVFRKRNKYGELGGHIMIIMEKPKRNKNTFLLRIADSAPFRHSLDTRLPHVSGIGIGTFLLKVNPKTFQPAAYAWTTNSPWKKNVDFAMARPMEML